jgi:hypothetical protein
MNLENIKKVIAFSRDLHRRMEAENAGLVLGRLTEKHLDALFRAP